MQVNSVQELEDRTVKFEGHMTEKEASIVIALGLNTLWANGLMNMIDNIDVTEIPSGPDDDETMQ